MKQKHVIKGITFAVGMQRVFTIEEYLNKIGHEVVDAKFYFSARNVGTDFFKAVLYSEKIKSESRSILRYYQPVYSSKNNAQSKKS